jgi:5-methylcytosine-specific restriction endonuclease McrA
MGLPECTCSEAIHSCRRHGLQRDLSKSAKPQRRKARRAPRAQSLKQEMGESRWQGIKETLLLIDPRCDECGVQGDAVSLELDHIVPRGRGGKNNAKNAHLLCKPCHREKHGVPEWGAS